MDVLAKTCGRPYQEVGVPAALGERERKSLTPGHPSVRVRNVHRKFGPKSLCLCCFFFPDITELICFEPKVCICNGQLEIKRICVSVMRDLLRRFPQICLCNGN